MNNNIKFLSIAIIAVAIIGTGLFLTQEEKPTEEIVPIRYSVSTTPNNFELATKLTGRDIPKEEGIKLEPITVQGGEGGTVTMQALLSNNLDTAGGSISIWANVVGKGGKVKLLLPGNVVNEEISHYTGLLVLENSSINTIKDLVGKRIAVNVLGAEADFVIRVFLKQNGISKDQVELVVMPAANQEQALRSKQVDAAAWTSNGGTQYDHAVEIGGVRKLPGTSSFEARGGSYATTSEGFTEEFIQKHPDTVRRYLRAFAGARRLVWDEYQKDPERVKKAYADIAEEKGGNPKLAKYYRGPRWSPEFEFITDKDVQFWIDNFVEDGILKPGQVKPSDVYTNEFNPYNKK